MPKISEFKGTEPFIDIGITKFMPIEDVLNVPVSIIAVDHYENDKGPGVAVAIYHPKHGECYINTHAVGIVNILKKEAVLKVLESNDAEDVIEGTFVKRKSQKSDRMVYALE